MPKINGRAKGASGEREFASWLYSEFPMAKKPERNLDQTRNGGGDLIVPPFLFEVKRVETLDLHRWWLQVSRAAQEHSLVLEPVVAFRQNKQDWNFLISARHCGCDHGFVRMFMPQFRNWIVRNWSFE